MAKTPRRATKKRTATSPSHTQKKTVPANKVTGTVLKIVSGKPTDQKLTAEKVFSDVGPRAAPFKWRPQHFTCTVQLELCQRQDDDGEAPPPKHAIRLEFRDLARIHNVVFTRILLDIGLYVAAMVFASGFSHLIRRARPEYGWVATLVFGAIAVWIGVTLVANGLEGAAALDTLHGDADPSAVRALMEGTLLIYNGSIAFVITGLFLAAAGYATFATGVLPRWTGWVAYAGAALCAAAVPAMYGGPVDYTSFYNPGGWGPVIIANFPPAIWFVIASISMIRTRKP